FEARLRITFSAKDFAARIGHKQRKAIFPRDRSDRRSGRALASRHAGPRSPALTNAGIGKNPTAWIGDKDGDALSPRECRDERAGFGGALRYRGPTRK